MQHFEFVIYTHKKMQLMQRVRVNSANVKSAKKRKATQC